MASSTLGRNTGCSDGGISWVSPVFTDMPGSFITSRFIISESFSVLHYEPSPYRSTLYTMATDSVVKYRSPSTSANTYVRHISLSSLLLHHVTRATSRTRETRYGSVLVGLLIVPVLRTWTTSCWEVHKNTFPFITTCLFWMLISVGALVLLLCSCKLMARVKLYLPPPA